jgi:hypothetical protein
MRGLRAALRAFERTVTFVILVAFIGPAALAEVNLPVPTVDQSAVARRSFFMSGAIMWASPASTSCKGRSTSKFWRRR